MRNKTLLAAIAMVILGGAAALGTFWLTRPSNVPMGATLAAGDGHICAVAADGSVLCWGSNDSLQLGTGGDLPSLLPHEAIAIEGLDGAVRDIAAGASHTCVLLSSGDMQCWGFGAAGQLGDGNFEITQTPVSVEGLPGPAVAISATFWQTCAIADAGSVWCWGENSAGQLGDGSEQSSPVPIRVEGLGGDAVAITTGQRHTCVLLEDDRVMCWGANEVGQLGDGSSASAFGPVEVQGLPGGIHAIAAGYSNTCALTDAGAVYCWGLTLARELSYDMAEPSAFRTTAEPVTGLESGVVAIDSGVYHACAVMETGGVKCWGSDQDGQIGDGEVEIPPPRGQALSDVEGLDSGVAAIELGPGNSCAILNGGELRCWGAKYGWTPKEADLPAEVRLPDGAR